MGSWYPSDIKVKGLPLTEYLCQENYDKDRMSSELEEILDKKPVKGEALNKIVKSAPYNILENTLIYEEADQRNSLTFSELFDDSLGELESTIIFSKEVHLQWLLFNLSLTKNGNKPLSLVYCNKADCTEGVNNQILEKKSNIKLVNFQYPIDHNQVKHNAKLMILKYTDQSIRIVVPSGSFTKKTWNVRSIILWVSDRLPVIGPHDSGNGDSVTKFKKELTRYLKSYKSKDLSSWISTVENVNFKSVNVFFVASIPGDYEHDFGEEDPVGHPAVKRILTKYSAPVQGNCPIVAQSKVISMCGRNETNSFLTETAISFVQDSLPSKFRRIPDFNIILTSHSNYEDSYNKDINVFYRRDVHSKQDWINDKLYHWNGLTTQRTRALHSMKSYARWSENGLYWFMFGSQNLSRSGFGTYHWINLPTKFRVTNYEVALLFMPRIMIGKDFFPMIEDQQRDDDNIFPLPYKVPLVPYERDDRPYFAEDKE